MIRGGTTAVLTSELASNEHGPLPRHEEKRSPTVATIALILIACLTAAALMAWNVFHARRIALSNAATATANTALTLAGQANSSFKMADTVLVSLVDTVEVGGWAVVRDDHMRNLMVKHVAQLPALQGLFLYDQNGRWMVTSAGPQFNGRSNADRAYFQFHKNNPSREVHIGKPIVGRTSGALVIPVSRRIEYSDGRFAGVALATIKVDFFRKLYERLDIGADGSILMTLDEGALLLQVPFSADAVGTDISSHPAFRPQAGPHVPKRSGEVDIAGTTHIFSNARVGDYQVGITVLRAKDQVLAVWLQIAALAALALALLITAMVLLGRRVIRQIALRERLQQQLLSTQTKLEAANSSLSAMAFIDGLTDLFNRRYYEQVFERELKRAFRNQAPLAVLMLDVDYFKKFNDRYGHPEGDECLKTVAQAILGAMRRSGDFAARYGGEEFVVVLPATDLEGARAVAEAIRAGVEGRAIAHADAPSGIVTISVGIHAGIPHDGTQAGRDFLGRADTALYRAKAAGRNRTEA